MIRYRLLILNAILLLALLTSYWGRRLENIPISPTDFMQGLNVPFRDWKTSDAQISDNERQLLHPDSVLIRRYSSERGVEAELAVIAGHHKQSVHTPAFCMTGGGWDTISQQQSEIVLADRTIPAMQMRMSQEGHQILVTYFFTNGDFSTRNLIQFQGAQFLRRFRSEIPEGALVRIIVPVRQTDQEAQQLTNDFARTLLPATLTRLSQVRLTPP